MHKTRKFFWVFVIVLSSLSTVHATFNVSNSQARSVAITDGAIVSGGLIIFNGQQQLLLAKSNFFGNIDNSFGSGGYVATSIGSSPVSNDIVWSNNEIVSVGTTQISSEWMFFIARYLNNGVLDTTFNSSGIMTQSIGTDAAAYQVVVDESGKYVVGGTSIIDGAPIITVVRYNTDGTRDATFGNNGVTIKRIFASASGYTLGIQSTGKIVAGGFTINGVGQRQFALVRFNADGSVDSSFGFNGTVVTTLGNDSCIYSLIIKPNNYIVVAGVSNSQCVLAQYTANGPLDTTFGSNGIATIPVGTVSQINDIAIQSNGAIVAVGYSDNALVLIRCNSNGTLDQTFGSGGIVTTPYTQFALANSIALQSNGQIVISGNCANGSFIARFNTDGTLDTSFGDSGVLNFPNNNNAPDIYNIADVNIADDAAIAYNKLNLSNNISDGDISTQAAIQDSKLAPIVTAGKVRNSATTATPNNVSGAIVSRDTLGNCSLNTLSAHVIGNVDGAASENLLKSGDTMAGSLILPAGTSQAPSLQFTDNENTGFSANGNTLALSTNGLNRFSVDENGLVAITAPSVGTSALQVAGDTMVEGQISSTANIQFNTADASLNVVGSTQGPLLKIFTGTGNTGLQASVNIDYSSAGFSSVPVICFNPIDGVIATLVVSFTTAESAVVSSNATINVPFNYIVIGI